MSVAAPLGECGWCERTVRWAVSAKSKKAMAFDPIPTKFGAFEFRGNESPTDRRPVAFYVPPHIRVERELYTAHIANCPGAEKHKKTRVLTAAEQALVDLQQQHADLEAMRLADELIEITRNKVGHFPTYLECRVEWPAFLEAHRKTDRRVLCKVSGVALRKLHPEEAALGDQAERARLEQRFGLKSA